MNRKQLTTLLIAGVLIGGLGLILLNRRASTWHPSEARTGEAIIRNLPVNEVGHIVIRAPDGELNLVRGQVWQVRERWDYPANFRDISEFLIKASNLKAVQTLQAGPAHLSRFDLLDPDQPSHAGTLVEFRDASGAKLESLLLGKPYIRETGNGSPFGGGGFPSGRYVMLPSQPGQVGLISEPLSNIEARPERWLDKTFFKVEKLKSVSVQREGAPGWTLFREVENGDFSLADKAEGEELDASKLWGVRNLLSSPSFNDVASPDADPQDLGLDTPLLARIETFDGLIYTLTLGTPQAEDNYPLQVALEANRPAPPPAEEGVPEDEQERRQQEFQEKLEQLEQKVEQEQRFQNWTYLVSKWTVDSLLKERSELLKEETEDSGEAPEADDLGLDLDFDFDFDFDPFQPQPLQP